MLKVEDGSFLASLLLPALEDLFILYDPFPVIPMVQRCNCRLQKLGLQRCSPKEGLAILEALPTLVELWWPAFSATLSPLIILTHPPPDFRPVAPELSFMYAFANRLFEDEMLQILSELMESRRRSVLHPTLSLCVLRWIPDFLICSRWRPTCAAKG